MTRKEQVLQALRGVIDPDLGRDIVSLNFVKDLSITEEGDVSFTLELTTPACPIKERFVHECRSLVSALSWVHSVNVTLSARTPQARTGHGPGLDSVANIIAVASKGGVGKSTCAVNLAYALAELGGSVGLFDADIYGPSLPTLVHVNDSTLTSHGALIAPHEHEGVKLMSYGHVQAHNDSHAPAIMRGPMVSNLLTQLLTTTDWGPLDYLVIDFPPGTGDTQLTLCQLVSLTAAVIVTTPQNLAFVDVVKGIEMFHRLKVPTVAVVENMSYFVCDGCQKKHYPFGRGAAERIIHQFGMKNAFEVPIDALISQHSDAGHPVVLEMPDSPLAEIYMDMARAVVREVARLQHGAVTPPYIAPVEGRGLVIDRRDGSESVVLRPAAVRRACRCASCVEEFTGTPLLDPGSVEETIVATDVRPMGNYAVAITWSDGHASSIYPYESLFAMIEEGSAVVKSPSEPWWKSEKDDASGKTGGAFLASTFQGLLTGMGDEDDS